MIRLQRPSMAVNDPRVRAKNGSVRRFVMGRTGDIDQNLGRRQIIQQVALAARAEGQKLKNLVLSCHGNAGYLQMAEGFDSRHLGMFLDWRGVVEKLWLPDSVVAKGGAGHQFVSTLARLAQCWVLAPTEIQCDYTLTFARDTLPSFEGLVLCYDPTGKVSWSHRYPSTWFYAPGASSGACHPNP